ncbi:MAG: hypothetical protein R2856_05800 [Caldilineaceae bacterium]
MTTLIVSGGAPAVMDRPSEAELMGAPITRRFRRPRRVICGWRPRPAIRCSTWCWWRICWIGRSNASSD